MAIRTGDIRRSYYTLSHVCICSFYTSVCNAMSLNYRGVSMAQSRNSRQLKKECAAILETMKVCFIILLEVLIYLHLHDSKHSGNGGHYFIVHPNPVLVCLPPLCA